MEAPLVEEGSPAPNFTLTSDSGEQVSLESFRGQPVVLYFYPKDDTPGCTKEACAFRDAFDKFVAADVTIFGVSRDPEPSHKAFQQKYTLPFPLVADVSGAVQKAYRVPNSVWGSTKRVSFLVGPDGKVARVFPDVDPGVHAKDLLAIITTLKAAK
jgi:peroxiredoxin Q/BCP